MTALVSARPGGPAMQTVLSLLAPTEKFCEDVLYSLSKL
jgi:hypothetical protein